MKLMIDGREACAYTGGKPFDPALPTVVMIHGALHDHSVWALQSRYLAHHGHGVLCVDLPGHGRSAGPALPDVESNAQWVVTLLRAVGARHSALVGHSMGSLIALEAAARLGDAASHLLMIGTAYPMKVSAALLETSARDPLKAIDMVNAFSISSLASKPSAPAPGFWLHGGNRALMRRVQAEHAARQAGANLFHHDFSVCNAYARGMEAAAAVRCPVMLLLGERDQMTSPKGTAELARALRAEVRTVPAGHTLMLEAPDAVLNEMSAFLRVRPPLPA